jgi:hypothetical protein
VASETTTTSQADSLFTSWVDDMIIDEVRPYNVMRPFFRTRGPEKAAAFDFPLQADPGAAGASYTEGTGLSNTELTSTDETATATSKGMMATITDELTEISLWDTYSHFGGVLARSVAERFETDATALLDDFANTTGTAGVASTASTIYEAVNQLEQRDQVGTPVAVLDPLQVGQIRDDIGTSGAAAIASGSMNVAGALAGTLAGFAFEWAGTPIYQTSLVTSTGGAVFLADLALGLYQIRAVRTELERDASLPGTEIVVTERYGSVEVRDVAGETVLI